MCRKSFYGLLRYTCLSGYGYILHKKYGQLYESD